jgi:hypothetical protein
MSAFRKKSTHLYLSITIIILFVSLLVSFNLEPVSAQTDEEGSVLTTEFDGNLASDWMQLLYTLVQAEGVNAPAAARIYGYAGMTLYESVVSGMPNNYSLSGQIREMPELPFPEEGEIYDWPAVADAALALVVEGLFYPSPSDETRAAIADLRDAHITAREAEVGEEIVERSVDFGVELGEVIKGWIATDNYEATRDLVYELPTGDPSFWVPTTEGQNALEPYWGTIRPFGLPYPEWCDVPLNMPFDTDPESTFHAQVMEVKEVGDSLTQEQQEIARFWFDPPRQTGLPAGHWVSIESQLVDYLELDLGKASEMYALVGMALSDAFISAWSLKYQINLLRPETYIHEYIQRSWQPYIQTPPFPEYPSGHSVVSGAGAEVLTRMFGIVAFTDRTHIIFEHEPLVRSFTSFEAAASEAAISRLYGGIHYRVAIENGLRQGRCVGEAVLQNLQLRPIPQGE